MLSGYPYFNEVPVNNDYSWRISMSTYTMRPRYMRRFRNVQPVEFNGGRSLPIDLQSNDDEFVLRAAVPGLKPEDLELEIHDGILSMRVEIKSEEEVEENSFLMREIGYGEFSRRLRLPERVDVENVEARIDSGLLEVHIPKSEDAKPKRITIKAK
jgi:HSP20 family protein